MWQDEQAQTVGEGCRALLVNSDRECLIRLGNSTGSGCIDQGIPENLTGSMGFDWLVQEDLTGSECFECFDWEMTMMRRET